MEFPMANKTDFSAGEWQQVVGGMFMAGVAVSAADPSGLWGMLKEAFASGRTLLEAKSTAGDSALVEAIVADLETSEGRSGAQAFVKEKLQGAKADDLKHRAIEAVRGAAMLVEQKAPSEAMAYKGWLLKVASNVAEASKEGGVLGFGGVAVSDAERATLAEMTSALGS
jgi:hypothetical protein